MVSARQFQNGAYSCFMSSAYTIIVIQTAFAENYWIIIVHIQITNQNRLLFNALFAQSERPSWITYRTQKRFIQGKFPTLNVKPSLSFKKNINGRLLHNDILVTLLICTHIWTSSYFTSKDLRSFHIFSMPLKFNLYCAIFRVEIYKSKNKYEVFNIINFHLFWYKETLLKTKQYILGGSETFILINRICINLLKSTFVFFLVFC